MRSSALPASYTDVGGPPGVISTLVSDSVCRQSGRELTFANLYATHLELFVFKSSLYALITVVCSQDDIKEFSCWNLFIRGQIFVQQMTARGAHSGDLDAKPHFHEMIQALYQLVSVDGRWMLDVPSKRYFRTSMGFQ